MFTRIKDRLGDKVWFLGAGALYTYIFMEIKQYKINKRFIEDMNLRTDLLNWLVTEGIYLEAEEFFPQYQERAKFINIVS